MNTKINTKHSPSFEKLIITKRAEKAFALFKQRNNKGTNTEKDVFERYITAIEKLQEDNPINIVIDYLKLGKNKSKKLALMLTKERTKITKPQALRSGFDEYPYIQDLAADRLTYTKGTPKYLQQIIAISDVANTTKTFLSKNFNENARNFDWNLDKILGKK